jgi:hypothetical protein
VRRDHLLDRSPVMPAVLAFDAVEAELERHGIEL